MKRNQLLYNGLLILLFFIPLHYYVCELLLSRTEIDNLWRDVLILVMFLICMKASKGRVRKNGILVLVNCIILLLYAFISYMLFQSPGTFNILRTYLIPMLMFFIASTVKLTEDQFRKIQKLIITELILIAAYGLFQAFILGDDFAVRLGYPSYGGYLSSTSFYIGGFLGFQRNVGTFISPNVCGVILGVALLICLVDSKKYLSKKQFVANSILIVAIIGTFSRSAILGILLAVIFYFHFSGKYKKIARIKKRLIWIPIGIVMVVVVVLIIDNYFLDGLFQRMLSSSFLGTVSGSDESMQKHIEELIEPLNVVLAHPFGRGFGINGPMAIEYSKNGVNVESSVYLMMFEIGIIPTVLYFIPYLKVIINTIVNKKYKYYVPATISIMVLVTYLLLPNVQTYEILFYTFLYMGFYYNPYVKSFYTNEKESVKSDI